MPLAHLGAAVVGVLGWRLARLGVDVARARRFAARAIPYERRLGGDGPALLVTGDSLSVGVGASSPELSVSGRIARACPGLTVRNVARSGARLSDVPDQLRTASNRQWDAVLLTAGGNDAIAGVSRGELARDAQRAIAAALRRSPRVVVATSANIGCVPIVPWPLTRLLEARSRMVRDVLHDACEASRVAIVDFWRPRDANPFAHDPDRWFGEDGVHPNSDCYDLCFRVIERHTHLASSLAASR